MTQVLPGAIRFSRRDFSLSLEFAHLPLEVAQTSPVRVASFTRLARRATRQPFYGWYHGHPSASHRPLPRPYHALRSITVSQEPIPFGKAVL